MPFDLTFDGSYAHMTDFLARISRFVQAKGTTIEVHGRLLSIDGMSIQAGRKGFPQIEADIHATAYLIAPGQDATGGATAAGPAGSNTSATSSGSAPATATVTSTP